MKDTCFPVLDLLINAFLLLCYIFEDYFSLQSCCNAVLIFIAAITQQAAGLQPKSTWVLWNWCQRDDMFVKELSCTLSVKCICDFAICGVKAEIKSISVFTETDMLMYYARFSSSDRPAHTYGISKYKLSPRHVRLCWLCYLVIHLECVFLGLPFFISFPVCFYSF